MEKLLHSLEKATAGKVEEIQPPQKCTSSEMLLFYKSLVRVRSRAYLTVSNAVVGNEVTTIQSRQTPHVIV